MMAFKRRAVLVGIMAAALAGCAGKGPANTPVAEAKIDDFAGSWIGSSQEETQRAAAVILEPHADGGFRLFWRNVQAGEKPGEGLEFRERELAFKASTRPNFWTATVPADRAYATASLAGPTLTVEVVGTTQDGKVERQLYRRTLVDGTHLKLAYTREVAGQPASTIEGDFIRKPA